MFICKFHWLGRTISSGLFHEQIFSMEMYPALRLAWFLKLHNVGNFGPSSMATGLEAVSLRSPSGKFCFCLSVIEGRSLDTGSSCWAITLHGFLALSCVVSMPDLGLCKDFATDSWQVIDILHSWVYKAAYPGKTTISYRQPSSAMYPTKYWSYFPAINTVPCLLHFL